jgi:acid phosphatase class B
MIEMCKENEKESTREEYLKLEKDYWNYVDNNVGDPITVQYAADLSVTAFGSGFGKEGQKIIHPHQEEYLEHPWNLNNLCK